MADRTVISTPFPSVERVASELGQSKPFAQAANTCPVISERRKTRTTKRRTTRR